MDIIASFDTSVTGSTVATQYENAVNAAIQFYDSTFTNPITLHINFGWGEVGGSPIAPGALGESSTSFYNYKYDQLYAAVKATDTTSAVQLAAVGSLPTSDPTGTGQAVFDVSTAEGQALGLNGASTAASPDGSVGLDSSSSFSWSQSSVGAGTYDAVGTLEHEISEVMGRSATGGAGGHYSLLDLFRYTANDGGQTDAPGTAVGARDEPFATGYTNNAFSYFSYDGKTVTLPFDAPTAVAQGADVADWGPSVAGDSYGYGYAGQPGTVSPTDLQVMNVLGYDLVCFLRGTRIATPDGEIAIERLKVGDVVSTLSGGAKPIRWIGRGRHLVRAGGQGGAMPVIVRAGALGEGVPNRDLRVTKGHSFYLDGVLIPVEFLINYRSILWDERAQAVELYHLELDDHDVLLADGAPAESYRDDGNRLLFDDPDPAAMRSDIPPCAPVLTGGPVVDRVWRRLLERAGVGEAALTGDPDLHLLVDGRRIDPSAAAHRMVFFEVPAGARDVRVCSRRANPAELGLARDPRTLGVALRRVHIAQAGLNVTIEFDSPALSEGFHAPEPAEGFRWTTGEGVLPRRVLAAFDGTLEIRLDVGASAQYPLQAEVRAAA